MPDGAPAEQPEGDSEALGSEPTIPVPDGTAAPPDGAPAEAAGAGRDGGPAAIACPSCGYLVAPPPTRTRPCPSCHHTIAVRQFEGRTAYLAEDALVFFDAERAREAQEHAWDAARGRWLQLAASHGVPGSARARIAAAVPSERSVEAARVLYMKAADADVRTARQEGLWTTVAQLRRAQAATWYAALGSPVPPPEAIVELHRDAMLAVLRSFAGQGTDAELVSAGCCPACRHDDGKAFKIAHELHEPRLPHAGCPKGLCSCDWWIGVVEKKRRRRRRPAGSPPLV